MDRREFLEVSVGSGGGDGDQCRSGAVVDAAGK